MEKVETALESATKRITFLEAKTDDLENRGRRKNLRIFGLKEGAEGEQTLLNFVTDMLPKWLGLPPGKTFTLERVHRTLANRKPNQNRAVLVRFLNFQEKEFVYLEARKSEIKHDGAKITFAQDLSAETHPLFLPLLLRRLCHIRITEETLALNASGSDLHEEISNTPEVSETSPSPVIPAGQPPRPRSVVQIRRRLRSSISDSSNAIGSSPPHGPRGRTRLRRPSDTGDSRRSSPTRSRRASDRRNRREATSPGNTPRALQPQA
ncbi:hypothetical protein D5F01_LYC12223 [Larimichthys crocea]|uniref:LINE-1 type transposase domain-containing protein 1 n=1 Tax=Larimichthys crocea TaxID=215358 RepID=A0A6G0IAA9_LARCR|nr:hypothetical protein D5F01_LYC12223 [Larimichthys crocea]